MLIGYVYRDHPIRQIAISAVGDDPANYVLYGAKELAERGHTIYKFVGVSGKSLINRALSQLFKEKADYCGFLKFIVRIRSVDMIVITSYSYILAALFLKKIGILRSKLCWIAVGYEDRIDFSKDVKIAEYFSKIDLVLCFGWGEKKQLQKWIKKQNIKFIPFGVPVHLMDRIKVDGYQRGTFTEEVISVGGDPRRDYRMVLNIARQMPEVSFRIIASKVHSEVLRDAPQNVKVNYDIPFHQMLVHLQESKVVLLCSQENNYSGATTVLLQAFALGKAVVVTQTQAIVEGYGWTDSLKECFIAPGDVDAGVQKINRLLADSALRKQLENNGKRHVNEFLSWKKFVDRIECFFSDLI